MDGIRVSTEQIRNAEKRLAEIEAEAETIRKFLDAVSVIANKQQSELTEAIDEQLSAFGNETQPPLEDDGNEGGQVSLPAAIRGVLGASDRSLNHAQIRKQLIESGIDSARFGANNSYYYTVVKRLVEHGHIKKRAKKYRVGN